MLKTYEGLATYIEEQLQQSQARVGIGGYLEKRVLYQHSEHFQNATENRDIHLGIDWWSPALTPVYCPLDAVVHKVYEFTIDKERPLSRGMIDKVFKYMKYLHESIENLHAIHIHRTPISLKAYCEIFIYIFPVILVPTVIFNTGLDELQ